MAKQPKSIAGRVVAITGGARGIGAATAEALVAKGARVSLGDLDADLAAQTAERLGGNAVSFELDVTDRPSFENFLDETERELGPIDVVVNNAGIMPLGRFADETDETARLQVDINIHGVLIGTKLALARMEPRNSGHIINIASQAGKGGFPGGATYCATKHAVVGMCEAVKAELEDSDVAISCVMPAVVNTELASGLQPARGVKNLEPEDVADAIVDAIETERFEVWVPRSTVVIAKVMTLMPRAGREAIAKALKADKVLAEADDAKRSAYESRAAQSRTDAPVNGGAKAKAKSKTES